MITDRDIALKYIMTLYDVTETEAKKDCYEDELKEAIRLLKIGVHPWTIADQNETKQLDWTDDEYYEGAWSWVEYYEGAQCWVDECELEDKEGKENE